MKIHELKIWPEQFDAVIDLKKRFEFRKNDRDFKVGDLLVLREWNPMTKAYSNRVAKVKVLHILGSGFGLPEGYCIMSIDLERIEVW